MRYSQSINAKQYAKAFLRHNRESITLDMIQRAQVAVITMKENRHLLSMLQVLLHASFHEQAVRIWCDHFGLSNDFYKLLELLYNRNKLSIIIEVLQDICCIYFLQNRMIEVEIQSAVPLHDYQKKKFEQFFAQQSGQTIYSRYKVDSSLIAGVRMQSDCYIWEYSIAARIKTVHQKLLSEGYYEYKRS